MSVAAKRALTLTLVVIVAFGAAFALGTVTAGDPAQPPGALPLDLGTVGPKVQSIAPPAALPELRLGG